MANGKDRTEIPRLKFTWLLTMAFGLDKIDFTVQGDSSEAVFENLIKLTKKDGGMAKW